MLLHMVTDTLIQYETSYESSYSIHIGTQPEIVTNSDGFLLRLLS